MVAMETNSSKKEQLFCPQTRCGERKAYFILRQFISLDNFLDLSRALAGLDFLFLMAMMDVVLGDGKLHGHLWSSMCHTEPTIHVIDMIIINVGPEPMKLGIKFSLFLSGNY